MSFLHIYLLIKCRLKLYLGDTSRLVYGFCYSLVVITNMRKKISSFYEWEEICCSSSWFTKFTNIKLDTNDWFLCQYIFSFPPPILHMHLLPVYCGASHIAEHSFDFWVVSLTRARYLDYMRSPTHRLFIWNHSTTSCPSQTSTQRKVWICSHKVCWYLSVLGHDDDY